MLAHVETKKFTIKPHLSSKATNFPRSIHQETSLDLDEIGYVKFSVCNIGWRGWRKEKKRKSC
jgi:hypothetical protein